MEQAIYCAAVVGFGVAVLSAACLALRGSGRREGRENAGQQTASPVEPQVEPWDELNESEKEYLKRFFK